MMSTMLLLCAVAVLAVVAERVPMTKRDRVLPGLRVTDVHPTDYMNCPMEYPADVCGVCGGTALREADCGCEEYLYQSTGELDNTLLCAVNVETSRVIDELIHELLTLKTYSKELFDHFRGRNGVDNRRITARSWHELQNLYLDKDTAFATLTGGIVDPTLQFQQNMFDRFTYLQTNAYQGSDGAALLGDLMPQFGNMRDHNRQTFQEQSFPVGDPFWMKNRAHPIGAAQNRNAANYALFSGFVNKPQNAEEIWGSYEFSGKNTPSTAAFTGSLMPTPYQNMLAQAAMFPLDTIDRQPFGMRLNVDPLIQDYRYGGPSMLPKNLANYQATLMDRTYLANANAQHAMNQGSHFWDFYDDEKYAAEPYHPDIIPPNNRRQSRDVGHRARRDVDPHPSNQDLRPNGVMGAYNPRSTWFMTDQYNRDRISTMPQGYVPFFRDRNAPAPGAHAWWTANDNTAESWTRDKVFDAFYYGSEVPHLDENQAKFIQNVLNQRAMEANKASSDGIVFPARNPFYDGFDYENPLPGGDADYLMPWRDQVIAHLSSHNGLFDDAGWNTQLITNFLPINSWITSIHDFCSLHLHIGETMLYDKGVTAENSNEDAQVLYGSSTIDQTGGCGSNVVTTLCRDPADPTEVNGAAGRFGMEDIAVCTTLEDQLYFQWLLIARILVFSNAPETCGYQWNYAKIEKHFAYTAITVEDPVSARNDYSMSSPVDYFVPSVYGTEGHQMGPAGPTTQIGLLTGYAGYGPTAGERTWVDETGEVVFNNRLWPINYPVSADEHVQYGNKLNSWRKNHLGSEMGDFMGSFPLYAANVQSPTWLPWSELSYDSFAFDIHAPESEQLMENFNLKHWTSDSPMEALPEREDARIAARAREYERSYDALRQFKGPQGSLGNPMPSEGQRQQWGSLQAYFKQIEDAKKALEGKFTDPIPGPGWNGIKEVQAVANVFEDGVAGQATTNFRIDEPTTIGAGSGQYYAGDRAPSVAASTSGGSVVMSSRPIPYDKDQAYISDKYPHVNENAVYDIDAQQHVVEDNTEYND